MKREYKGSIVVALLALCLVGWMPQAGANLVEHGEVCFSGEIDSSPDVDASVLDALIDYYYDSGVLTMTIYNNSGPPDAFTLSELMFNTSDDVTGLTILDDGGLSNTSLSTGVHQGGMGTFEWDFDLGQGNNGILAGGSETVTFSVTGSNLDTSDFFNGLSTSPGDGLGHFLATIHFTRGPDGASDWVTPCDSSVVPEPATISLLGLGLAALATRRLRRSTTP